MPNRHTLHYFMASSSEPFHWDVEVRTREQADLKQEIRRLPFAGRAGLLEEFWKGRRISTVGSRSLNPSLTTAEGDGFRTRIHPIQSSNPSLSLLRWDRGETEMGRKRS